LCHYVDAEIAFHERVRERAYQIFEERGKEHGHDLDDWRKASAEIAFQERVGDRAKEIFEERGKEQGHALDDWLKAEAELST
jgi:Protein of unknown function (DUF2934)